jgi:hypothetical protein
MVNDGDREMIITPPVSYFAKTFGAQSGEHSIFLIFISLAFFMLYYYVEFLL